MIKISIRDVISQQEIKVKMSKDLYNIIAKNLGYDVANVYQSILSGGINQDKRMLASAGEKILIRHEEFFRNLLSKGNNYEGLSQLYKLIKDALNLRSSNTPKTFEELMNTPMHPDVKNIKAKLSVN